MWRSRFYSCKIIGMGMVGRNFLHLVLNFECTKSAFVCHFSKKYLTGILPFESTGQQVLLELTLVEFLCG
jgi:hypothetical protein